MLFEVATAEVGRLAISDVLGVDLESAHTHGWREHAPSCAGLEHAFAALAGQRGALGHSSSTVPDVKDSRTPTSFVRCRSSPSGHAASRSTRPVSVTRERPRGWTPGDLARSTSASSLPTERVRLKIESLSGTNWRLTGEMELSLEDGLAGHAEFHEVGPGAPNVNDNIRVVRVTRE